MRQHLNNKMVKPGDNARKSRRRGNPLAFVSFTKKRAGLERRGGGEGGGNITIIIAFKGAIPKGMSKFAA